MELKGVMNEMERILHKAIHVIKYSFLECLNLSSVHGIPKIFKPTQLTSLRVLWLVCFLCSTSYCIYMVTNLMRTYLNYSVATSIQEIEERPMQFPMVVICDFNSVNTDEGYNAIHSFGRIEGPISELWSAAVGFNRYIKNINNESIPVPTGLNITDMLISCSIALTDCTWQDFEPHYDIRYGNCFKFNSGKYYNGSSAPIKTVSSEGNSLGLILELFVGKDSEENEISYGNGAVVLIANQSSNSAANAMGLYASTGQFTQFAIKKSIKSKLGPPYSNCLAEVNSKDAYDSRSYRQTLNQTGAYDDEVCGLIAFQYLLIDECGCQEYGVVQVSDDPFCFVGNCSLVFRSKLSTNATIQAKYKKECPAKCLKSEYQLTTASASYPSRSYANKLKNMTILQKQFNSSSTFEEISSSVLAISVYFSKLSYEYYSDAPLLTIETLVSNLGGFFGLCMGLSFLSLVECFELLIILFNNFNRKYERENKVNDAKIMDIA